MNYKKIITSVLLVSDGPVEHAYFCDNFDISEKELLELLAEINDTLSENDFGRTLLGNPLPIILSIKENDNIIWQTSIGQKKRGDIKLKLKTILSYNPESIYEFSFSEEGIISKSSKYIKSYNRGEWAFDEGIVYLGNESKSWFKLDSYWIPSMTYEKNTIYNR